MTQNSETFGSPASVTPSAPGGEWDGGAPAERTTEQSAQLVDEIENSAWEHDPDEINREMASDFEVADEDEQVVGDETPSEPEVEVKTDEEQVNEPAEEDGPTESPRANDRIRQLVQERNALEAKLEAYIALQEQRAAREEQLYKQQQAQIEAQRAAETQKQFLEQLKQYGFDDANVSHVLALQALEAAREAKEAAQRDRQEREKAAQTARYKAYENALSVELDKSLTRDGKQIVDPAVRNTLYKAAYAVAREEQLANPSEAVKRVVAPILAALTPQKPQTKRPQPSDQTHKVISTSGRAVGKSPGTRASGKKPLARDVQAFLK